MDRNYEELGVIGKGAYGTVFKAKDVENDRLVALKRVRIVNNTEEKGVPVSTLREITLLKQLDNVAHPNIVRMFDAFQTFSSSLTEGPNELVLTIVFEHVEQDLSMFLHNCPSSGLPEYLIKDLMHQLLSGLDYLHMNRLIHRDIKPQNILITKNKKVKIADFGLARVYGFCKLITSVVVTLWYRSPEVLLQCPYATKVDLWSVGAIMAEMYNRRPLFPGKSELDQLQKILKIIGTPSKEEWPDNSSLPRENFKNLKGIEFRNLIPDISDEGLELLKNLLVFDPDKRFNAKTCLEHRYFEDVRVSTNCNSENSNSNKIKKNKENDNDNGESDKHELPNKTSSSPLCLDKLNNSNGNCSNTLNAFTRVDSGIDLSSSSNSDRPFFRTDSGICVSPPVVSDSDSSNDVILNEKEDTKVAELDVDTLDLLVESKEVLSDDLLKSPPHKILRKR